MFKKFPFVLVLFVLVCLLVMPAAAQDEDPYTTLPCEEGDGLFLVEGYPDHTLFCLGDHKITTWAFVDGTWVNLPNVEEASRFMAVLRADNSVYFLKEAPDMDGNSYFSVEAMPVERAETENGAMTGLPCSSYLTVDGSTEHTWADFLTGNWKGCEG